MNNCIFCNAANNLVASMHVKTKIASYTIWVCQDHEEHASPKKIREIIEKREADIAEFEAKARSLGYTLTPIAGGIVAAAKNNVQANDDSGSMGVHDASQPQPQPQTQHNTDSRSGQQQTMKLDPRQRMATRKIRDIEAPTNAIDPAGRNVTLEKHESYNTTEVALKDGTKVNAPKEKVEEAQVVSGRGGVPISIPRKVVGDAGVTDIIIVDTGGDRTLQNRFKSIANDSINNYGPDFKSGYAVRDCTLCGGAGISRISKDVCPKCKGAGTA